MQDILRELPPNLVLFVLVLVWIVPLLIAGIVGYVRLRRVYRGLQMPAYPINRKGELFDWTYGPKTASAAKYSFFGSLVYSLLWMWILVRMHLHDSHFDQALYLASWAAAVLFPIRNYVHWRRLVRKSRQTDNSFQVSGEAK